MLLGPPPEKWQAFYANVTNPPANPYVKAPEPQQESPAKAAVPLQEVAADKPQEPPKKTRARKKKD